MVVVVLVVAIVVAIVVALVVVVVVVRSSSSRHCNYALVLCGAPNHRGEHAPGYRYHILQTFPG